MPFACLRFYKCILLIGYKMTFGIAKVRYQHMLHLNKKHLQLCLQGPVPTQAAQTSLGGAYQLPCHLSAYGNEPHHEDTTASLPTHPASSTSPDVSASSH